MKQTMVVMAFRSPALIVLSLLALCFGESFLLVAVHTHIDVATLFVDSGKNTAGIAVKLVF